MLLWNRLLVLFVLLAGFPWNTARSQLYLLSLTVKNSDVSHRISHCDSQNLQYKTHPEFWPSHRRIFKTSLYYKTRLILETRRYMEIIRALLEIYEQSALSHRILPERCVHCRHYISSLHLVCTGSSKQHIEASWRIYTSWLTLVQVAVCHLFSAKPAQRTHDIMILSLLSQNDITSFWGDNDSIIMLCAWTNADLLSIGPLNWN